jgi:hypothetical protein
VSQLWQLQGEDLCINPHPGQFKALTSERRFTFMLAGTQGGKTSLLPLWLFYQICEHGPGDYLAVTATFPLLKLKLLPAFLELFRDTLRLGTFNKEDMAFQYSQEPTRVIFGSATNPESLESATAKAAILDECGQDQFRLESWDAIQRRLSLHQGRVLGGTTLYNLGWLKSTIYDPWLAGDPDIAVIQFPSISNPAFPRAEYERLQRIWPAWKFAMFCRGEYAHPPGLIYSDYDDHYREDGGHLVHPFDLPAAWPRYVGIDPGAVNTATAWFAHDPHTHVSYVYHESLEGNMTTAEHATRARRQAEGVNVQVWKLGAKSESQQRLDWRAAGIPVSEPVVIDVEAGLDRPIQLFKTRALFVFDTCRGLRDELGTYSRVVGEDGQVTEKIKDKEKFHRLDALRYGVQGFTGITSGISSYRQ